VNPQFFHIHSTRIAHDFRHSFFRIFPARFPHDLAGSADEKNGERQAVNANLRKSALRVAVRAFSSGQ